MRKMPRLKTVLVLLLFFAAPVAVLAQTAQTGTIAGQVKDESGGSLPGVSVTATSQERGFSRNTTTDAAGKFRFAAIPIGRYRVAAALSGFEVVTLTDNLVETEKTTELTIVLRLAAVAAAVTVTGEVPIVDRTNTTATTRLSVKEWQKLPIGRSYQTLFGQAPGVVGTGNANVHGALGSNNQFLFDGVDITDPTTGTFGANLNFEAIQEVVIQTAGLSAEYGRAVGGFINVITKSGTNRFEGSAKYIVANDDWNDQNRTKSETTGASLKRVKFDQVNPVYTATLGGPVWKDHAWFFGAYERSENTSSRVQIPVSLEEYQQSTLSNFYNVRLSGQVTPNHSVWVKASDSPTDGFVVNYWGSIAERKALTRQDQGADSKAVQWSGVFGRNFTGEALYADNDEFINVFPFEESPLHVGAPHLSLANNRYYNGATFDGFVKRPRRQATLAASYHADIGGNSHSFKGGFDWQYLESGAQFAYPNNQRYIDDSFDHVTRTWAPNRRQDYDLAVASTSKGDIYSVYVRDKFEVGRRLFFEVGARYEKQTGETDVGRLTVDTQTISPRFSGTYDLRGNGKTLILGTYGRLYQYIIQGFVDDFAEIPQQGNYDNYVWNAAQQRYVFSNRVVVAGSTVIPNTELDPTYIDEVTIGFQQQLGNVIGLGIRGIWREWGDLVDDIQGFNPDRTTFLKVVNYAPAKREYRGIEFTFEKRFSQNWNALASYTYSRAEGNHFSITSSSLGDWLEANCRTTVDPTIGVNGVIPCREVQEGRNKTGLAGYDVPHSVKLNGSYTRSLGPVQVGLGVRSAWASGGNFTKNRSLNVLLPGTTTNAGPLATYFYEERGSNRLPSSWVLDTSLELTFPLFRLLEVGAKAEVFNVTDRQKKTGISSSLWCENTVNPVAACTTARNNYAKATTRGAFQAPRSYRFSTFVRF